MSEREKTRHHRDLHLGPVGVLVVVFAIALFGFMLGRYSRPPEPMPPAPIVLRPSV